jgi:hypothetical protein
MGNDWLRLWHDMPNDPKWRTIARISKQSIPCVIAVYTHMLVTASNAKKRGSVTGWSNEDIASALDMETEAVRAIFDAMQGRVLDGERLRGWDARQPKREDDSSERVRAYRDREKQKAEALGDDDTRCNADVTRANAPEAEADHALKKESKKDSKWYARARPVDNSGMNGSGSTHTQSEVDLNLFENAVPVLADLLGVARFSEKDQNSVARWCERYEMRCSALPLIAGKLEVYRLQNQGKNPKALEYFEKMLVEQAKQRKSEVIKAQARGGRRPAA